MDEIKVQLIIGPAYFGEPRLVRDVFEIVAQAAMGHTRKIVTNTQYTKDPKIGVQAKMAATAHPDAGKQIAAAIKQSMLLADSIPVEVIFEETDVMLSDNIDELLEAVTLSQKGLKQVTDNMFDHLIGYTW